MAFAITARAGNPAHDITARYQELMGETDLDLLKVKALNLVTAGKGISAANAAKFRRIVTDSPTLTKLQFYLTNFVLAADGLVADVLRRSA